MTNQLVELLIMTTVISASFICMFQIYKYNKLKEIIEIISRNEKLADHISNVVRKELDNCIKKNSKISKLDSYSHNRNKHDSEKVISFSVVKSKKKNLEE